MVEVGPAPIHDQPADRPLPMTGVPSAEQIHELATMVRNGDLSPGSAASSPSCCLAVLLDALGGVVISDWERDTLTWLARYERSTVENIAAVITRARQATQGHVAWRSHPTEV